MVLGIAVASFRSAESFLEPQIGFLRYVPAGALTPLFLLWLGIDESPKIWLIVVGTVFFNVLMIADVARAVPQELVEASYTLGAGRFRVLRQVILPHSWPGIVDVARVNLAAGWLMLVIAELLAARGGPGLPGRAGAAHPQRRHDVRGPHHLRADRPRERPRPAAAAQAHRAVVGGEPMMKGLVVDDVSKEFPAGRRTPPIVALDGIDLHVEDGELVCIVGASGCGKSTLLRIVGGLDTATSGEVRVDGDVVVGPGPDRGMVFQGYSLFPWRTVSENIAFGLECAGWSRSDRQGRVTELLGIMQLTEYAELRPGQLSGGMRQRVAIARALAPEPDVLLLDEPFGALDAQTKRSMQDFLLQVRARTRATILMVTHDVAEAVYLSQRTYVLSSRPGKVAEEIEMPFGDHRGPLVWRDPRFLDLRDEIEDLLTKRPAVA